MALQRELVPPPCISPRAPTPRQRDFAKSRERVTTIVVLVFPAAFMPRSAMGKALRGGAAVGVQGRLSGLMALGVAKGKPAPLSPQSRQRLGLAGEIGRRAVPARSG